MTQTQTFTNSLGNTHHIEPILSKNGKTYWCECEDKLYINRLRASQYQKKNWDFAQRLIDDYTLALDVGANNGCNTIHYAERFQTVMAWECTELAQHLWQRTIEDNQVVNAQLEPYALSDTSGAQHVVIHAKNGGHNHIENQHIPRWSGKRWTPRRPRTRKRAMQEIQMRLLDDYDVTPGFVKIDVEGHEWQILRGAEQTIGRARPTLQLEIVANQCRKFGYWAQDMIEWLRERDYVMISKKQGVMLGEFGSYRNTLLYEGEARIRGDMDLFAQPRERCITRPWIDAQL